MRTFLFFLAVSLAVVACQRDDGSSDQTPPMIKASAANENSINKGKIGPVDDVSQLHFSKGQQTFMHGAANLIQGAWVSQCFPANVQPHIPCIFRLPFYRMFYLLFPVDSEGNMLAQHFVREYNDPLCRDNFSGPFDPRTRKSVEIVGFYRISDQSNLFPNVLQISFEFTQCSGACQNSQNPINGVYLNQVKLAALRESDDQRQVLFWGDNFPTRVPGYNPFIPDQVFNWNVPFYRLDF